MIEQRLKMHLDNSARTARSALTGAVLATLLAVAFTPAALAAETDTAASDNGASASQNQSGDEYSQANHLLFMTNHLENVETPSKLEYSFSRRGDSNNSYDDKVDLTVESAPKQAKKVHIDFLSGDRNRYVPDVNNARGNPVIMMFLQNDVLEVAQRTGGSWRYFQRQIKFALQRDAKVEDGSAEYNGQSVDVKRISFKPFKGEKVHREDIGTEAEKQYVFTLSDDVPGGVLELRTETPATSGSNDMVVERVAFKKMDSNIVTDDDKPNA
ncbi:hypothetical protein [Salinisphaera aquimarina]|uniref:Outer membrane lipoprotein-sorting protein n=1 Tax=Salinisphaera aquimarina TaxID=2094031 RepID=A0ABV7ES29_9GAMM